MPSAAATEVLTDSSKLPLLALFVEIELAPVDPLTSSQPLVLLLLTLNVDCTLLVTLTNCTSVPFG